MATIFSEGINKFSDDEIVIKLSSGCKLTFEYFYKKYSAPLNGSIYRQTGDIDVSEIILEKVFIQVWNEIHTYDKDKFKLYTWLAQIARQNVNKYYRDINL